MLVEVSENCFVRKEDIVMLKIRPEDLLLTSHILMNGKLTTMSIELRDSIQFYAHLKMLTT